MNEELDKGLIESARDLQEFFLGTYAEHALEAAIKSGNNDLLMLAVKEYSSAREMIQRYGDE